MDNVHEHAIWVPGAKPAARIVGKSRFCFQLSADGLNPEWHEKQSISENSGHTTEAFWACRAESPMAC
jgi:hypothetical protein